MGPKVTAGFFLEKTFARMCRELLAKLGPRPRLGNSYYSIPSASVSPEQMARQYRGLQRDPLQGWVEALHGSGVIEPPDEELEAGLFLTELEDAGKADWGIVFALEDAQVVVRRIVPPVEREVVWARILDTEEVADPPAGTVLLGYEPGEFYPPDCNSFVGYAVLLEGPRSPGIKAYHEKLNRWGLFDNLIDAQEYAKEYAKVRSSSHAHELPLGYYMVEVRGVLAEEREAH